MLKITKKEKRTEAEIRVDEQIDWLAGRAESPEDVQKILRLLKERKDLNHIDKKKLSPDTILVVAGNLVGILLLVGYEHAHVITSKALGFILKGRV